ncbi:LuxR C-terminal-related transcriptional regulator [Hamadaea sp. NPDC050747]|uniref:helix-turn-helix transcriptional regulator n=1 Tax=Hamadaea sp. NPDC050747 TaxID=3155789 RepID=UPI0033F7FB98
MEPVGRDGVLAQAWRIVTEGGAVQLHGPAGIGKTAVWRALVDRAREEGWLVLGCAPTENEAGLPFAALADLLTPLAEHIPGLPLPQRIAAEAVLLSAAPAEPVDERAIGAATRSLLAAVDGSALLAIDDAPWLDPPSERAVRYALRRLAPGPSVLISSRAEVTALGLDERPSPVTLLGLDPLGVGPLHHILYAHLRRSFGRPLLARIARDAAGNPLLAIELARAVLRLPQLPRPGDDLPVAASMHDLVAATLRDLPAETREAVRLAALLAAPTLRDLAAAGVPATALDAAEEVGLLTVDTRGVHFAHPVYASAVRAATPEGVRLRTHRQLAATVADPDERARQLARSAVEPDATVAADLEQAAARQRTRGAPATAAHLYDRAADLTPQADVEDAGRRVLAAIRCRFDSGDYAAAATAAEAAVARLTGDQLAEARLLRASVAWAADDLAVAVTFGEQALATASPGTRLAGRIHAHICLFQDSPAPAREHAETALALLDGSADDRPLLAGTLLNLFFHEVRAGLPARTELVDRALDLEDGRPTWLGGTVPAIWWKAIDDHGRARTRLRDMLRYATAAGDEAWQHEILTHLGETELLAGRFTDAEVSITAALDLGRQLGTGLIGETWLAATVDAYRGRLDRAGAVAEAGLRHDDAWARRIHLQLAGFVALSAGRMRDAADAYAELADLLDATGVVEPIALRFEPDWLEACIGAGDLEAARAILARLERRHARQVRPWTTLGLARSRVLLASAIGEATDTALAELIAVRDATPPDVVPLDRARCLLVAGVVHRRARRKREARSALQTAVAEFTTLGAAAFAAKAEADLARTGGRTEAVDELTPTELRVARLAALGQTNQQIADELFISPKTVEANLARAYRKLGIRRRAELARVLPAA